MDLTVGTGEPNRLSHATTTQSVPGQEKMATKPVPDFQKTHPLQFQLNQLRRRFSPGEKDAHGATALTFNLVPTDPDFPFEMTDLQCTLLVPHSYPFGGRPSLRVTNPEMERGYQINVEQGFDSLATAMPKSTLLALINQLDKRLEGFLMAEKAQTIKLVANTGKKASTTALRSTAAPAAVSTSLESSLVSSPQQNTPQEIAEARAKRESDIRQLEARMGRQACFSQSSDGLSFSVPLQLPKSSELPISLSFVKCVKLLVPLSYNLSPCLISMPDVSSNEAETVRAAFERHARAHPEMSLMAHVNHLAQNMHTMAVEVPAATPQIPSFPPSPTIGTAPRTSKDAATDQLGDRPHIRIIPRPPEWDIPRDDNAQTDSSDTDGSEGGSSEYETDEDEGGATTPPEAQVAADTGPDLGILLSFPSLELYGVELLRLCSISLTVKCDRCKEMKDVKSIRSHAPGDTSPIKHESCNKCANRLSIGR